MVLGNEGFVKAVITEAHFVDLGERNRGEIGDGQKIDIGGRDGIVTGQVAGAPQPQREALIAGGVVVAGRQQVLFIDVVVGLGDDAVHAVEDIGGGGNIVHGRAGVGRGGISGGPGIPFQQRGDDGIDAEPLRGQLRSPPAQRYWPRARRPCCSTRRFRAGLRSRRRKRPCP